MEFDIHWLKKWSLLTPDHIALQEAETGRKLTYRKCHQEALKAAHVLQTQFQIKKGDRIAVLSPNELEYILLFFAVQYLGAILVPLNSRLTLAELKDIIADCRPKGLCVHPHFTSLATELHLQMIPLIGAQSLFPKASSLLKESDIVMASPDARAMILYTSGTTGFPKGVIISQKMIFWNSVTTQLRLYLTAQDCTAIFLPLFHTGGWNVLTTPLLHQGGKVVLMKKFDAGLILQICEQEKLNILFGVPTTLELLTQHPDFKLKDLSSLRYLISGGESLPLSLIQTFEDRGVRVRQGYGLTEFGPNVFSLDERYSRAKMGSIGTPNAYIEVRVVDDQGFDVAQGITGELWLKGPMKTPGYWQTSADTTPLFKQEWLATGDLVRQDEDGFFFVVGRKKDMFISGGENIYPAEIERVLLSMSEVKEVAVIGVPDHKWGEVGQAFVVTKDPALTTASLLHHCQQFLAKYKIPKHFVFVSHLPKSETGKVLKGRLLPNPVTSRKT